MRAGARGEKCVDHRALGGGSASGTLARFELSAQARRRSEGLAPAALPPPRTRRRNLRKGSSCFGFILKASMVGFTLLSRSYSICVDEVPAPRSRPTTVRQGNGGLRCTCDYHLSRGRGQGRLRRCEGVLWAFKNVEDIKIAKTCVAGSPRSGPRRVAKNTSQSTERHGRGE